MERIDFCNDVRNTCTYLLDIREDKTYRIDNKELYIVKQNLDSCYSYIIMSYKTIVAYAYIDIDNNDNIKHIRYIYSTHKYSRTTTKHIRYIYRILDCLSVINDCDIECNTFRDIEK